MRRNEQGLTLLSFIVVMAVVGVFIYVGMKVVPMYAEYFSVKKALEGMAGDAEMANNDAAKIKDLFFRRMDVNYSEHVKPENIVLKRREAGWVMTVDYEARRPLIANLDVVGHFTAEKEFKRTGD